MCLFIREIQSTFHNFRYMTILLKIHFLCRQHIKRFNEALVILIIVSHYRTNVELGFSFFFAKIVTKFKLYFASFQFSPILFRIEFFQKTFYGPIKNVINGLWKQENNSSIFAKLDFLIVIKRAEKKKQTQTHSEK